MKGTKVETFEAIEVLREKYGSIIDGDIKPMCDYITTLEEQNHRLKEGIKAFKQLNEKNFSLACDLFIKGLER